MDELLDRMRKRQEGMTRIREKKLEHQKDLFRPWPVTTTCIPGRSRDYASVHKIGNAIDECEWLVR